MNNKTDKSIIEGIRNGRPDAQKALFKKYGKQLYSICLRYVGSKMDAEDALQESFIRIFKYFEKFDPQKGNLANWMQRICVNESLKRIQTKKEFLTYESMPTEPEAAPLALSQLQMEDLMRLILQLPLLYRTVFNMYLVEGYSHKEIADTLGIEASSSRSILTRAKAMVRKQLDKKKHESWI